MSMRPQVRSVPATSASTSILREMLQAMTKASRPCWRMSRATASQTSALRLDITTMAPSRAMASALARPMPRLEPVTIATLPSRANGDPVAWTRPSSVMALPIGLREIFAQLLFGHRLAVDLVGAVGKTQHAGARVGVSEVKILANAAAAADLDGAVDDVLGHVGGHHLDHGNPGSVRTVFPPLQYARQRRPQERWHA